MSLARKPVKATYAHKRGRATVSDKLSSSPLKDLEQENISRSEMSRRMLKRSHRLEQSQTLSERLTQERSSKRLKPSPHTRVDVPVSSAVTLADVVQFDINDTSQFKTPYPSVGTEKFVLSSSVGQAIPPEKFSPLPLARHLLSRTSSRNLKENSSRGLDSPFSSRPGSVTSSPKRKNTKNTRRSLKSRTLSDVKNPNDAPLKPSESVTQSTQHSPLKSCLRDRRPSVPAPAYMLRQISDQDWLVPPKALSRAPLTGTGYLSVFGSPDRAIDPSAFLNDFPQAASTPHHKHETSITEYQTSLHASQCTFCTHEMSDMTFTNNAISFGLPDADVSMLDGTHTRTPERPKSFTSRSIVSANSPSPSTRDAPAQPNQFKFVSLKNYDLAFPHLIRSSGTYDIDDEEDSIVSPTRPVHRPIPLPYSSPEDFSDLALPPPLLDPSLAAHPAWSQTNDLGGHDPVLATPPQSPRKTHDKLYPLKSSPATSKLQGMFSVLGLDELSKGTVFVDDEPAHDSGVGLSGLSTRSRSLGSPVEMKVKKGKGTRTRDRRGTIRASDYMQSKDGNASNASAGGAALTRRTRSGTVIGPPKPSGTTSNEPITRTTKLADRAIRNNPALLPPLSDGESEDELLLKTHWCDDYWTPVTGKTASERCSGGESFGSSSDDDLLLKAEEKQ